MDRGTIIMYSIPAYGHINSNLYFAGCLARIGYQVLYYATEPFRKAVLANGCEYREYPLDWKDINLSDGKKLLKLYRLILKYTDELLPPLLEDARREKPCGVIFDSLALWGRAAGQLLSVPSFAFYSIAAIDWRRKRGYLAYASGFFADYFRYAGEIPEALRLKRQLKKTYKIDELGLLPTLMNRGNYNLMGYSRRFQPRGRKFGADYIFLGQVSFLRAAEKPNDFACPKRPLIYISLGTVFNKNDQLLKTVFSQFGEDSSYHVVMAWDLRQLKGKGPKRAEALQIPENFIVRPFVNQSEIMSKADLFITAGGMNSIHEALYFGVPCLLCPQQGEQLLNAKRFEKLGFGLILKNINRLSEAAEKAIKLRDSWDEKVRRELLLIHLNEAVRLVHRTCAGAKRDGAGVRKIRKERKVRKDYGDRA